MSGLGHCGLGVHGNDSLALGSGSCGIAMETRGVAILYYRLVQSRIIGGSLAEL